MITRKLVAVALISLSVTTAVPAISAVRPSTAQGTGIGIALHAFGSRGKVGAASPKLGSVLADLSRHLSQVRAGHELADLQGLSPAARFKESADGAGPRVLIDAVTRGDPQQLKAALVAAGLTGASVYLNDVSGWLPLAQLSAVAARDEVAQIHAAMPHVRVGEVTSQGDYVERSAALRSSQSLDGTGVTVGILSDSFNCYAQYAANGVPASGLLGYAMYGFTADYATDVSTGDLPANVNVLEDADCLNYVGSPPQLPFTDEGRAMLQIVYDVAPGASLSFYTAENGKADFANGIVQLAAKGAKVEADDAGYPDEPFFQDGVIAQAVDQVEAQGVAYFSAAGNDSDLSWESASPSFPVQSTSGQQSGEMLLNFDTSGATTTTSLPIQIAQLVPGEYVDLVVEWDQPFISAAPDSTGATSQIDVCVSGSGQDQLYGTDNQTSTCTGPNPTGVDPVQILVVGNPATDTAPAMTNTEDLTVTIGLVSGPVPGRIKFVLEDDGAGSKITQFDTQSPTIQGHPGAAGAAAVAAAYYFTAPPCGSAAQLEPYSSEGGDPILFDTSGNRLATPVVRQKPDFVGPDAVNNTFLGFVLTGNEIPTTSNAMCEDMQGSQGYYPTFAGTSAATPHAAGIAALLLQAVPSATPTQIYQALRSSAVPMGTVPNFNSGYGFIQADAAFTALQSSVSGASSSSSSAPAATQPPSQSGGGGGGSIGLVTLLVLGGLLSWQLLAGSRGHLRKMARRP